MNEEELKKIAKQRMGFTQLELHRAERKIYELLFLQDIENQIRVFGGPNSEALIELLSGKHIYNHEFCLEKIKEGVDVSKLIAFFRDIE